MRLREPASADDLLCKDCQIFIRRNTVCVTICSEAQGNPFIMQRLSTTALFYPECGSATLPPVPDAGSGRRDETPGIFLFESGHAHVHASQSLCASIARCA